MNEAASESDWAAASSRTGSGPDRTSASADRLAQVVFGLLVLACFAAFFVTQRLKHSPTAVQSFRLTPRFSPTPAGHIKQERISFKLSHADAVTVTVLDASGDTVATLVTAWPVPRYKTLSLRWDGRRGVARSQTVSHSPNGTTIVSPLNTGAPAREGEYRVRVHLARQNRTLLSPRSFTLVRGSA